MSETIFDGTTIPNNDNNNNVVPPTALALPTEVAELVGEGKKYRTAEEALKALPHAQSHIKTLEEEAKQLREELAKRKAAEELLDEFKSSGFQQQSAVDPQPAVQPEAIEAIVASILSKKEAATIAQRNISTVVSSFEQAFGDKAKAEEVYNKVAEESGLSIEDMNRLAATSPEAVLRLAGITKKQDGVLGKVHSTVNPESLSSENTKPADLSAKVKQWASTKDLVGAWRAAGEKVKQQHL